MSGESKIGGTDRLMAGMGTKRLSRRAFMERALASGLSVAAAGSLWSLRAAAATPKKGGIFRVGLNDGNTADQMDPGKYQSQTEIQLVHTHRSFLTMITSENGLGTDMADGWEASSDAKNWTFTLDFQPPVLVSRVIQTFLGAFPVEMEAWSTR